MNLKLCLINAENLFLLFDQFPTAEALHGDEAQWQKLSTSVYENKSLKKTWDLAKSILEINPDILMLCEVGGIEFLESL